MRDQDAKRKEPKQERAQRTLNSLLDALERLLDTHEFGSISVRDIAGEAGVTTGALYGHVASKEDLLDRLHIRHCDELEADWMQALGDRLAERSLSDGVYQSILLSIRQRRASPGRFRAFAKAPLDSILQRQKALNAVLFRETDAKVRRDLGDASPDDIGFRVMFCVIIARSVTRDWVDHPDLPSLPVHFEDEQLAAVLTEMFLVYFNGAPGDPNQT